MKKIIDYIAEELADAFEKAGYDRAYGKVTLSNRPDLCEYQCNGAMAGAKAYKKAPFMIAEDVVALLKDSACMEEVEVVKSICCRLSEPDGRSRRSWYSEGREP